MVTDERGRRERDAEKRARFFYDRSMARNAVGARLWGL